MSTVGYGDVGAKTVLGKMFIVLFIMTAIVSDVPHPPFSIKLHPSFSHPILQISPLYPKSWSFSFNIHIAITIGTLKLETKHKLVEIQVDTTVLTFYPCIETMCISNLLLLLCYLNCFDNNFEMLCNSTIDKFVSMISQISASVQCCLSILIICLALTWTLKILSVGLIHHWLVNTELVFTV